MPPFKSPPRMLVIESGLVPVPDEEPPPVRLDSPLIKLRGLKPVLPDDPPPLPERLLRMLRGLKAELPLPDEPEPTAEPLLDPLEPPRPPKALKPGKLAKAERSKPCLAFEAILGLISSTEELAIVSL